MAPSLFQPSLLLILFTVMSHCAVSDSNSCFRMTAAFNYNDKVYLVSGGKFIKLNSSLDEIGTGTMEEEFDGYRGQLSAAFVHAANGYLYFFQGNHHYDYSSSTGLSNRATENSDWSPFFEGGIDAAGKTNGQSYFFKECKYVTGDIVGEEYNVHDIGLPCDISAAWGHDDHLYVTKGDNVWIKDAEGNATGPDMLSNVVSLTSTTFCHEEGDPHTLKVRAEQQYEEEHGCVIVDAAIDWNGYVYIINDHECIKFDRGGNENGSYSNLEWGGLGSNIDAGITWSVNGATYFFKGSGYYKYRWGITFGPFSNDLWSPFFEEGIDAAGNHDGQSYFFKGCEISCYSSDNEILYKSGDLDLPCDVNAAFSRGKSMYVIKRDQVWTWRSGENKAIGPAPLSTVAQLTSWTACSAESD